MKPNHHWAVHVFDQILDYGPVYSFWAFLPERLNKVLKNLNSNNSNGGELEVSMMREFHRAVALEGLVNVPFALRMENAFVKLLFVRRKNKQALGTIEDAASYERTGSRVLLGEVAAKASRIHDDDMRLALTNYYNRNGPVVHLPRRREAVPGTVALDSFIDIYRYALVDGRRTMAADMHPKRKAQSSLIQIMFNGEPFVGEIYSIFSHPQAGVSTSRDTAMTYIKWLVPSQGTPFDGDDFIPELGVETWVCNEYAPPNSPAFPPQVFPLRNIQCQVARGRIHYMIPPVWVTTTMDRVRSLVLWCFGAEPRRSLLLHSQISTLISTNDNNE
ncbi:hypothetical protein R3P38DRAFT_2496527 [Favolaschia claudopus]|uniref:Uncharacterized protein n=1 Tax=Favolaschia claudopus TaxID=2862362 RepID=A0AAW0E3R6_9AGAR